MHPILLIDDDADKRRALRACLEGLPLDIQEAYSGEQGLKLLLRREYAVILLDVKMPGIDGFETARLIRQSGKYRETPIIFVSSYGPGDIDLTGGYSLGAVDFIFTPIEPVILKAKVAVFVELYRKSRHIMRQAEELEWRVAERTRELAESEERFRKLIEDVRDYAIYMIDPQGIVTSWNKGAERIHGYSAEEILGRDYAGFFIPEDMEKGKPRHEMREALANGRFEDMGWRVRKDGAWFWCNEIVSPIRGKDGGLTGFTKVTRDITEWKNSEESRHRWEEELKRANDQLDVILQGIDISITAQSPDGKLVFANEAAARRMDLPSAKALVELPREEFLAKWEMFDEKGEPFPPEKLPSRMAMQGLPSPETLIRFRKKGSPGESWSIVKATPILDESGRVKLIINFAQDMTALKSQEIDLRNSKEQLAIILEGIDDAIIVQAPSGKILYLNQAAARLLEYPSPQAVLEAAEGPRAVELRKAISIYDESGKLLPVDQTPGRFAMRGLEPPPMLLRYRMHSKGREKWVISRARPIFDDHGNVRYVINITHDITGIRKAEEELRQSQKMEAIGRLAGGIAHDFNNLLTAINGYSDLALGMTAPDSPIKPLLEEVLAAGQRAASLTNQLLAHSRKQILAPKIINLNHVVTEMDKMLKRVIGEDIGLSTRLDPDMGRVKADPGQMEQVILNLAVNARDAMPKGGKLTIETGMAAMEGRFPGSQREIPPGKYAVLSVSDTGHGMTEEVKSHLYEPFYTTKELGRGTGLGLSTVYGIVKQSGGYISVYSEPGKGATFRIYLPLAGNEASDPSPPPLPAFPEQEAGRGTILLVEDEEAVRRLAKSILTARGHRVLEATDGDAALSMADAYGAPIDLLLTDVVMGGMGGQELARRLKQSRPNLKVIYMSGYTDDAIVRHGVLEATAVFIQKPFSPTALAKKVNQMLLADTLRNSIG